MCQDLYSFTFEESVVNLCSLMLNIDSGLIIKQIAMHADIFLCEVSVVL